jgi:hypothetical protein
MNSSVRIEATFNKIFSVKKCHVWGPTLTPDAGYSDGLYTSITADQLTGLLTREDFMNIKPL